jgi:imidazolonepropionase
MTLLVKNIKSLVQVAENNLQPKRGKNLGILPTIENAYLVAEDGKIKDFGKMEELPEMNGNIEEVDAEGRFVFPTYIDTHTHIVFPESREKEFELKIKGATYEEIARAGGGILNSAAKLKNASEDELFKRALVRIDEVIKLGTGALEIKSGYGLSVESELKMLRVIKRLKEECQIPIKANFLGAHAIPKEYKNNKSAYINLIINEMLPEIEREGLADFIDIFIEEGFYSLDDAKIVLEAGIKHGLKPKIHVDQMNSLGGVELGIDFKAISVDHLENISEESIENLRGTDVIPTLLPSCSFYLNMVYPPARKMIDAGLPVSIASDYNPGSSPSGNLNFSMSLACIKMKMMPEEAINAVTANAAHAMEMQNEMGVIAKGYKANFFITKPISSYSYLPYSFGNHVVDSVFLNGKKYIK